MTELVIPATTLSTLREAVLRSDGHEWFAFVFCGRSDERVLATDVRPIAEEDHQTKSRGGCRVDPELELSMLGDCVTSGERVPLLVHSHPFQSGGGVGFSSLDAEMMQATTRWLEHSFPEKGTGPLFGVMGQDSFRVARYDRSVDTESEGLRAAIEEVPVDIIGEWALDRPVDLPTMQRRRASEPIRARHDRTVRAISEDGQTALRDTRLGIVSAGGIGSVLVEQFARLGVGELVVVDPDIVEESNLSRLYGATAEDVGREKVAVMAEHVERLDPNINVETHATHAQDVPEQLQKCDALVAGVDQMSARMWLNEFAVRHLMPYVDAGSIIRTGEGDVQITAMEGIVQTIVPNVTACFSCLDRGNPEQARIERLTDEELEQEIEDGYVDGTALTPEPAVIHLNSLVASKAVDSVVKLLTEFDTPTPLVKYEGLGNDLDAFQTSPSAGCVVCGDDGMLGRGYEASDLSDVAVEAVDENVAETVAPPTSTEFDSEWAVDGDMGESTASAASVETSEPEVSAVSAGTSGDSTEADAPATTDNRSHISAFRARAGSLVDTVLSHRSLIWPSYQYPSARPNQRPDSGDEGSGRPDDADQTGGD
jgi:molybdopterin/thiamine biosynthesis adenylyltransferase